MRCLFCFWQPVLAVSLALLLVAPGSGGGLRTVGSRTYQWDDGTWWLVDGSESWEVLDHQVVVETESALSDGDVDALLLGLGLDTRYRADWGPYCHLAVPDTSDPIDVVSLCLAANGVEDAWADTKVSWAASPSDSFYARRIGTGEVGDTLLWWHQWNLRYIDAEAAWDIETGDTAVVIAMLDTGIQLNHDDLRGNLWINWEEYNGVASNDDDGNGFVDDIYGPNMDDSTGYDGWDCEHGVWVAGLMAAQTNNDEVGIAGLAGGWYDGQWQPGDRGSGCLIMTVASPLGSFADLAAGLAYAADMGADVANMSFSCSSSSEWNDAIDEAVSAGVVLVAATDNQWNNQVGFPASDSDVVAVGAADRLDHRAYYSNYGTAMDVLAPSGACKSCRMSKRCDAVGDTASCHYKFTGGASDTSRYLYWDGGDYCVNDSPFLWSTGGLTVEDEYDLMSGTSGAAPQVAALAGLLKSYDSSLTRTEIRSLICDSAEDLVGDSEDTRGWDDEYGYGRINAYAALFLARGGGATASNLRLCYDVEFDRDVKISSGDTLTILPGVDITFASGSDAANLGIDSSRCELIVEGTLIAAGTHADTLVTFTTEVDSAGAWYGIRALADTGTIHMEYCAVENAYKGIAVEAPDSLYVSEVTIEDCVTHGISCKECDSSMTVESCTITDPGLIGIDADDCDGLVLSDHDITDATAYGIRCLDAEGMTVEDNTILGASGESAFVGIHYVCASSDTALTIEDNTISRCGSRGIYCEGGGDGTSSITGNVISDDGYDRGTVGIYLKTSRADVHYNETEKKGTAVTVLPGTGTPKWIPDIGDSRTQEQGNNSWLDNTTWYVWTLLSSPDTLYAVGNWHGTTTPSAAMFSSSVHYQPVLEKAPGARINPGADDAESYEYSLSQNRPNPFNPTTTIEYSIWAPGRVTLRVYNMAGKLVRTLVNTVQEPGYHDVIWDGSDDQGRQVAGGVYFTRMVSGGETKMRKLILLK